MSINLLDILRGYCRPEIVALIGGILGENTDKTQTAVDGALPALVGGLIQQASTDQGADNLASALDQDDDDILDDLSQTLSGSRHQALMVEGGGLLSTLFSGKTKAVASHISESSGIPQRTCTSLLGLLAPIVMAVLGKETQRTNLSASGLTDLLSDQKDPISGALPTGIGSLLGLGAIGGGVAHTLGLSEGLGAVQGAAAGVADSAQGTAEPIQTIASGPADTARDATSHITLSPRNPLSTTADAAGDLASKAGESMQEAAASATAMAQRAGSNTLGATQGALADTTEAAPAAVTTGKKAISGATGAALGAAAATAGVAASARRRGRGWLKTLLILAALLILGWLAYHYFVAGHTPPTAAQGARNLGALNQLSRLIGDTGSTLGGITNIDSATKAQPEIEGLTTRVNGLQDSMGNLPAPIRKQIGKQASAILPNLQSLVDRVAGIPGVKETLQPTMDALLAAFEDLTS